MFPCLKYLGPKFNVLKSVIGNKYLTLNLLDTWDIWVEPGKKQPYLPLNPGCLIGILTMSYYNPHITGQYFIPNKSPKQPLSWWKKWKLNSSTSIGFCHSDLSNNMPPPWKSRSQRGFSTPGSTATSTGPRLSGVVKNWRQLCEPESSLVVAYKSHHGNLRVPPQSQPPQEIRP